ncbi:hypothetical protein RF11_00908 [Thelohanellus kitauei]|uniref:Uncharacterized protein n=1 Tax=Thelohanellus kitauei TaxID=669202 RepID=A0A0C2MV75_THEKT|nr:hypothetical protein RF11_00908 [Thelohanellus kitauei]
MWHYNRNNTVITKCQVLAYDDFINIKKCNLTLINNDTTEIYFAINGELTFKKNINYKPSDKHLITFKFADGKGLFKLFVYQFITTSTATVQVQDVTWRAYGYCSQSRSKNATYECEYDANHKKHYKILIVIFVLMVISLGLLLTQRKRCDCHSEKGFEKTCQKLPNDA